MPPNTVNQTKEKINPFQPFQPQVIAPIWNLSGKVLSSVPRITSLGHGNRSVMLECQRMLSAWLPSKHHDIFLRIKDGGNVF